MVQRSVTGAEARRGADGLGGVVDGAGDRIGHGQALSEADGAGRGQGAAGAVGVAGLDARPAEQPLAGGREEEIDHLPAGNVAALDQHSARAGGQQQQGGAPLAAKIPHRCAGQGLGLGRVRGQKGRAWDQQGAHGLHGVWRQELCAALGQHDRVDHRRRSGRRVQHPRHDLDHGRRAQHAGLDRVGADVLQHRAGLRLHHLGRNLVHAGGAKGVLYGDGGDGGGGIAAQGGDGLDVGLHARPAAGVRAGDDQHTSEA